MKSPRFPRIAAACLALAAVLVVVLAFRSARAATQEVPRHASVRASARAPRAHDESGHTRTPSADVTRIKDPSLPIMLEDAQGALLAFPPRESITPLTVIYLHGIHGRAENGCPWLREGAREIGWLVCPSANARLPDDTFSWSGTVLEQRAVVERAERAAHAAGADPERANVLVGFSQGAFVALDLVRARLGRTRGLVLIGANVAPSRAMLAAAGVARIVLAAGELDATFAPLQRAAAQLRGEGMDVRFLDLGRIGHSYATTDTEGLRDAIAWSGGSS